VRRHPVAHLPARLVAGAATLVARRRAPVAVLVATTVSVVAVDGSLAPLLRLDVPGPLALDVAESLLENTR
jgi:hypothetical protein